ncbi:MAG: DUF4433 domain-containing protein [Marinilabiliaceae bacterium]
MTYYTFGGYGEPDVENLRKDWREFRDVLDHYGITRLYHFTDRSNIAGIARSGGLLSWRRICQQGVNVPRPGGSDTSHSLDMSLGLDDYVRLSFVQGHPMMYVAVKNDHRIDDPVVLEISTDVLLDERVLFSDCNAASKKKGFSTGGDIDFFRNKIRFDLFRRNYFSLDESEKPYYQAEVLVPGIVPLCYIMNREECGIYESHEKLVSPAQKVREERSRQEEIERQEERKRHDERRRSEEEVGATRDRRKLIGSAIEWADDSLAFCASRTVICEGGREHVKLSWSEIPSDYRQFVKSVTLNGELQSSNSLLVCPAATTSYTLSLDICGEVVRKSVTVSVVPMPVTDFTSDFEYVVAGSYVTLQWDVKNAQSVELDGYGVMGGLSGSFKARVDADTIFTLIVTGLAGKSRVHLPVHVMPLAQTVAPVHLIERINVLWPDAPQILIDTSILDDYRRSVEHVELDKELMSKTFPGEAADGGGRLRTVRRIKKPRFAAIKKLFETVKKLIKR